MSEDNADDLEFEFETTGERLASARKGKGLSIEDIASKTRVPIRHLRAIEASDYAGLPGRTYAIGFAKAFARMVDLPEDDIANSLRSEIDEYEGEAPRSGAVQFEIDEPSKIPSARIAWIAAAVGAILILAGFGIWRTYFFPGADDSQFAATIDNGDDRATQKASGSDQALQGNAATGAETAQNAAANVDRNGQVVFTATIDNVWVKFYDGNGDQLMQKQMALGERYIVPADAENPQIWTGRPDGFSITVGGKSVPPLGDAERAIKDVPISASALLDRPAPSAEDADGANSAVAG